MSYMTTHDVTSYTLGSLFTGFTALLTGSELPQAAGIAVILPALVLLLVNLPKFLRESLLLYREYKNKNTGTSSEIEDGEL